MFTLMMMMIIMLTLNKTALLDKLTFSYYVFVIRGSVTSTYEWQDGIETMSMTILLFMPDGQSS